MLVLLAAGESARTHYFCRMMGRVVASCCCAEDADGAWLVERRVVLRAPDCCERLEPRSVTSPAVPGKAAGITSPSAVAPVLLAELPAPSPHPATAMTLREARAPPAVGPPLFISHCALLI
jgi:hypothetical protein